MQNKQATITMNENYDALMMDYACGTLDEAQTMIVCAHLALAPSRRDIMHSCETIGGALLDDCCTPAEMSPTSLDQVLERLDQKTDTHDSAPTCCVSAESIPFPLPLPVRQYLDNEIIQWKKTYPGFETFELPVPCSGSKARLIKVAPGIKTPEHAHSGIEITLMLDGFFHDESGTYKRGDLIVADEHVTHQPISDESVGCVCLSVSAAPIKLPGLLGKIINPFLKA